MPSDKYTVEQNNLTVTVGITQVLEVSVHQDPQNTAPFDEIAAKGLVANFLAQKRKINQHPRDDYWWQFNFIKEMPLGGYSLQYTLDPDPSPAQSPAVYVHITERE